MDLDIALKAVENYYDKDVHDEKVFSGIKYLLSVEALDTKKKKMLWNSFHNKNAIHHREFPGKLMYLSS